MAQLTCQNLCVGYDGQSVLQDLSFELLAGDYLCIVGENGSGKSTLMKTILGLQTPISGRILTGDGLRKTEIGYLPQQTVVQKDFPASVREIVLSGCQGRCGSRPFYNKEEKKLAVDAIDICAFEECKSLKSVVLPNSITSIGCGAFKDCESLTSITLPNSVASISDRVFSGCKNLKSVTIPKRLEAAISHYKSIEKISYTDSADNSL